MDKKQKFISYLRVSTDRQGVSGLGLEAQRSAVDTYLKSVGGVLLNEFVEIESGGKRSRPILVKSISLCRDESATLIIAKLDRLARNVAFISSLMESGVDFLAVDSPYANKLMIHILAAFAEHEREQISERTRAALASARQRGVRLGANGENLARKYKQEAQAAAEGYRPGVQSAMQNGAKTFAQIAAELNASGYRTRKGAAWKPGTTHRLLGRLGISLSA